jgi:hypothetical protein
MAETPDDKPFPDDWTLERVSVEELERRYAPQPDARAKDDLELLKPFGFMNREWEALKAQMQPGDELVMFASPPESWRKLYGRAGVALLRNGKLVDSITTVMN